ncbi:PREDICTED: uncharacterized protein LOC104814447 [Tarenaya hassleriana]|uniref:uncharacterized protein LOC104814447 n=1 Tax=Tarenaya hassleriana TaxID=28532 RepID=UPI00053C1637|nr:PREDICTED: uncharacterized protein LOC104814447 [Tarenaya hassleriana]
MADDDVWQCLRHPSKWRRSGVCPICLHERLSSLCPDCAHSLPCSCSSRAAVSPSSSFSSSSSSLFSYPGVSGVGLDGEEAPFVGIGSVGRVASLIECEPAFRRSKSMAVPFVGSSNPDPNPETGSGKGRDGKTVSFWRMLLGKRGEAKTASSAAAMMRKSRSMAVPDAGESRFSPAATGKGKGWYFPSPIKVFRQSRMSKMVFQQRSPLYRG